MTMTADAGLTNPRGDATPDGPGAGLALLGYAALSAVLTWPLVANLTDGLPLGNNDIWQNLWNFWWWKISLLERCALPYETDLLFFPGPTSLAFHTHSEANIFLTFPALLNWGPVAALNLATLLGFVIAGWGGYLLARELIADRRAAFLAGMVFAFFPQHFEQSLEHLNLSSYGGMAFFLWALIRSMRRGGAGPWVLAAAFFSLNALFSWHNGILILPGALLLFVWELCRTGRPRRRILVEATLAGLLAALLCLPFAWPMIREIAAGETYYLKPPPPFPKPVDLLFLGVPAENHTLWGSAVSDLYSDLRSYQSVGFTAYLGWVALGLAGLGWARALRRRRQPGAAAAPDGRRPDCAVFSVAAWSTFFLLNLLFALGTELRVAGADTGFPLPYALLRELPLFKTIRVANRYLVPSMLGLGILAAWGAHLIFRRSRRPWIAFSLAGFLIALDYLWLPYPLREVPEPRWVVQLDAVSSPGALLNIPGGYRARAADDMFLQTYHRRPLIGGYVSCTPPAASDMIERYPFLRTIYEGRPKLSVPARQGLPQILDDLPIAAVAVHLGRVREDLEEKRWRHRGTPQARLYNPEKGIPRKQLEEIRRVLRQYWGEPYYRDGEVELYRRPAAAPR